MRCGNACAFGQIVLPASPPPPVASRLRDHAHRADRAARPIRIAPTARRPRPHPSRCGGNGALAGKNRAVCIHFSPNARKRPPPWQYLHEMHASRDQDGKILALCVRFRAQSGDLEYMARESCHQGPLFASRAQKSYMARRCCQCCPTFRDTAARVAGPRTGRTGFVPCGPGLVRLPHARVSAISYVLPLLAPGACCPAALALPMPSHQPRPPLLLPTSPRPAARAARAPPRFPQFP